MPSSELTHLLLALLLLLCSAHAFGYLFSKLGQPSVVGEIVGGLFLGPTVCQALWPGTFQAIFESQATTKAVLSAVYQLGLLFLMFTSGLEARSLFVRAERRTAVWITLTGTLLPFAAGIACVALVPMASLMGEAQHPLSFVLVFGIAVAVTSIPVISRIFMDLGILRTPFARIVLSAAVLEDVLLYVVLGVALALVNSSSKSAGGPLESLLLGQPIGVVLAGHALVHATFFFGAMWAAPKIIGRLEQGKLGAFPRKSPVGFLYLLMFAFTLLAQWLGITPMLGAFLAGMIARSFTGVDEGACESIRRSALGFSIPVYFALVGIRLNFYQDFSLLVFVSFLVFASLVKGASVYLGARIAGEKPRGALNLAACMNARGGPGIVLASAALDAAIISAKFYTVLVVLAIVSSIMAGSWLEWNLRKGRPLR